MNFAFIFIFNFSQFIFHLPLIGYKKREGESAPLLYIPKLYYFTVN